ncbi:potassium voltage-gated channel subfamily A member 2-like isoform X7 [Bolinopsis microptera]|uniref:potassium voltage-gated channel subfamily A member 2-like isoform X7 n=1 Tax=Bolinopsis microptera TaxID=2820187 RepID=UPI00307AE69A
MDSSLDEAIPMNLSNNWTGHKNNPDVEVTHSKNTGSIAPKGEHTTCTSVNNLPMKYDSGQNHHEYLHQTENSLIKINVSGKEFTTTKETLRFFPDTLLGSSDIEDYYNEEVKAYYFDRHRGMFTAILFFYQSRGVFRSPTNIDRDIVEEELEFFKVDLAKIFTFDDEEEEVITEELSLREKLHNFLMDPHYSKAAMLWAFCDMMAIVLSVILLVAESVPDCSPYFDDTDEYPQKYYYYVLYGLEILINGFFTLDFTLKIISWPKPWLFFKNVLNVLDLLAILPFYIELIAMFTSESGAAGDKFVVLRICRTSRVVRIFRFIRHSKELIVVMKVIAGAAREFVLLSLLIAIFVLLFGTLMYYAELGRDSGFDSILLGCWWSIVTVTTVGYGDLYPQSPVGRLIGSVAVVLGIVILALPMTVIVSKFNESYGAEKRKAEKKTLAKIRARAGLAIEKEAAEDGKV